MNDSADRKVAIFTEALQFSTEERSAYLSRVCAGDLELRRQVDELLRSHDEAGDMLTRYLRARDAFLHREKAKTMDRTVFDRWAKSIRHLHQKTFSPVMHGNIQPALCRTRPVFRSSCRDD